MLGLKDPNRHLFEKKVVGRKVETMDNATQWSSG